MIPWPTARIRVDEFQGVGSLRWTAGTLVRSSTTRGAPREEGLRPAGGPVEVGGEGHLAGPPAHHPDSLRLWRKADARALGARGVPVTGEQHPVRAQASSAAPNLPGRRLCDKGRRLFRQNDAHAEAEGPPSAAGDVPR